MTNNSNSDDERLAHAVAKEDGRLRQNFGAVEGQAGVSRRADFGEQFSRFRAPTKRAKMLLASQ